jgi:hypothetical protein
MVSHDLKWIYTILQLHVQRKTFIVKTNVDERFIFTWSVNKFKNFIYPFIKGMSKNNICAQQLKITSS